MRGMSSDGLPQLPKIPQLCELPAEQVTPLVLTLLEICHHQREQIQQLRDEIARLKGEKPKPKITASTLENPPRAKHQGKRPKKRCKRRKTRELRIHETVRIRPEEVPEGSRFKGLHFGNHGGLGGSVELREFVRHAAHDSRAAVTRVALGST